MRFNTRESTYIVNPRRLRPRGFTLIEMLVSVAIFTVVMVMALGALLALSSSNRKAESLKSAVNNLNFALDSMSRAMRTSSGNWGCGAGVGVDCPSGATALAFTPASGGSREVFRFETSDATLCGQSGQVGCITRSLDGGNTFAAITSPEIVITSLKFYTVGTAVGSADNAQPKINITLSGTIALGPNQNTTVNLQTTVTQRLYDQ